MSNKWTVLSLIGVAVAALVYACYLIGTQKDHAVATIERDTVPTEPQPEVK